jgi:tetratricopeptide (TPR) repeat protein
MGLFEALHYSGKLDDAIAEAERMIAEGIAVGTMRASLALIHAERGDAKRALELVDANLATTTPGTLGRARELGIKAAVLDKLGRYAEAAQAMSDAVRAGERHLLPDDLVIFKNGLASILVRKSDIAGAIALLRANLAKLERDPEPDRALVRETLTRLSNAYAKGRRFGEAIPVAERALAMPETSKTDTAMLTFVLARSLYATNRDRPRAVELGKHARDLYAALRDQQALAEVDAWVGAPR